MEKVWGTRVFEIEEHVHVQKGKAIKERDRSYKGKKRGMVIHKAGFLWRHEGMGCRTDVA